MIDLKLTGYTVERFNTLLTPDVANMSDSPENSMRFRFGTGYSADLNSAVLHIEMRLEAKNSGDEKPFASIESLFHFTFETPDSVPESSIDEALRTTGLQLSLPVARGLIVGVSSMLNLPDVFSFPPVDFEKVEWRSTDE